MKKTIFVLIIALLWSFSEIFLRAKILSFPYHSALLTGLAFGFLIFFYSIFKDLKSLFIIILITLFVKWLSVPVQGIAFSCIANTMLAIGLDGLIFVGILRIIKKPETLNLIALGGGAALVTAFVFRTIGIHVAPCPYLLSFSGTAGLFRFVYTEGLTWILLSSITVPVFYFLGNTISNKINKLYVSNKKIYFETLFLVVILALSSNIIALFLGY
jgi:hypothetical protein